MNGQRKTPKMLAVQKRIGSPLEKVLPEMITDLGQSGSAEELGVSKATVGYWLLKLGIEVRRVALGPGDKLTVERADGDVLEIKRVGETLEVRRTA